MPAWIATVPFSPDEPAVCFLQCTCRRFIRRYLHSAGWTGGRMTFLQKKSAYIFNKSEKNNIKIKKKSSLRTGSCAATEPPRVQALLPDFFYLLWLWCAKAQGWTIDFGCFEHMCFLAPYLHLLCSVRLVWLRLLQFHNNFWPELPFALLCLSTLNFYSYFFKVWSILA